MSGDRWPWAPLAELLGGSVPSQAKRLGVHDRQIYRWRQIGVTTWQADRLATAIGSHPSIIWPGWDCDETLREVA